MSSETKQILTTDGIPLEVSLKKAERKNKIKAFLLVAPLLLFLIITYIFPIGEMFSRSIDDKMITNMLPKTFKEMETWDGKELPPEEVFAAFYADFKVLVEKQEQGKLGQRLNKEKNGFNSITKKLLRQIKRNKIDENQSIKEVDANDKTSNGDKDIDLEVLTYKCFYDETITRRECLRILR